MNGTSSKKLVSRVEFANMAGVSPAAVTKACKGALVPALEGKRIDAAHPSARKYIADRFAATAPGPATGIDPLYEKAVVACFEAGRYTPRFIRDTFKIGADRSNKILSQMKAAGLVPTPNHEPVKEPKRTRVPFVAIEPEKEDPPPRRATREGTLKTSGIDPDEPPPFIGYPDEISAFLDYTLRQILERFGTITCFRDWLDATRTIEMINEKRLKNAQTRGELISRDLVKTAFIDPIESAHIKLLTDGAKTIARRSAAMNGAGEPVEEIEKFVASQISSFIKPAKAKIARSLNENRP